MERPSWPANLPSSRKHAVEELLRGQESAKRLRDLFNDPSRAAGDHDGASWRPVSAEDLVVNVLQSFDNTLSLLSRAEPGHDEFSQVPVKACVKSEDSEESSKTSVPRDRRGCYKRRKTSDTQTRLDHNLIDDGHQWRKYGQKAILNSEFPRNYFRCTHKIDQACQATKQVQKIKDDPPIYRTIYQGHHTCKKLILKSPSLILDSPSPGDSSILLSFNTSLTPKQDNEFSTVNLAIPNGVPPMWSRSDPIDLVNTSLPSASPHRMRYPGVLECWVIVESVSADTHIDAQDHQLAGLTDADRMRSLETDACPGFLADPSNRVKWVNGAFERMVMREHSSDGVGSGPLPTEIAVRVVAKAELPKTRAAFACRATVRRHSWRRGEEKWAARIVPCDVWRMDEVGGFAWRLDVKAALSLGLS